jgi:hypothetical protein
MQLDTITPEQQVILDAAADEWMKIGLQTGPGDYDAAIAGVRKAYKAAGAEEPKYFIHMQSPYAGALAVCVVKEICSALTDLMTDEDGSSVVQDIRAGWKTGTPHAMGMRELSTLPLQIVEDTWNQFSNQLLNTEPTLGEDSAFKLIPKGKEQEYLNHVWSYVRQEMYRQVDAWSLQWESAPVYGAHDAAWLAFYDTLGRLGMQDIVEPMTGMMEVAKQQGWWWPLTDVAVITDRPTVLNRNANGELHCTDGPAISFSDGWSVWAINRIIVTKQIVEAPETLTIKQIVDESNAEIKRLMLERYGMENFIRNSGAQKLDQSDYGILWKTDVGEDEPLVMVEVVCPSTDRVYMLRVPPTTERARDAVAWTFDLPPEQYSPEVQA